MARETTAHGNAARGAILAVVAIGAVLAASTAPAADLDVARGAPPLPDGVPCDSAVVASFPDVWQGHFNGGRSFYTGPGGVIALDWRDETLCFPSRRTCDVYVHTMRRAFHRPEGDFTCLPIR